VINSTQKPLPCVKSVATALPANYVSQEQLFAALHDFWRGKGAKVEVSNACIRRRRCQGAISRFRYTNIGISTPSRRATGPDDAQLALAQQRDQAASVKQRCRIPEFRPRLHCRENRATGTRLAAPRRAIAIVRPQASQLPPLRCPCVCRSLHERDYFWPLFGETRTHQTGWRITQSGTN
jgi:hypothetical protein